MTTRTKILVILLSILVLAVIVWQAYTLTASITVSLAVTEWEVYMVPHGEPVKLAAKNDSNVLCSAFHGKTDQNGNIVIPLKVIQSCPIIFVEADDHRVYRGDLENAKKTTPFEWTLDIPYSQVRQ